MLYMSSEPDMRWFGGRLFWGVGFIMAAVLAATVGGQTLSLMLKKASPAQASLYGQERLTPGLPARFRVLVMDSQKQRPLGRANVEVALKSPDGLTMTLAEGSTDREGWLLVEKDLPRDLPQGEYVLSAKASSATGESVVSRKVTVKRTFKLFLTTDKPLYQPGQILHIRCLALAAGDRRPASHQKLTIEVQDSKGNKVFKKITQTSGYGVSSADFPLADQVNHGEYQVTAILDDAISDKTVTVKPYVLPKYKVDLTTDKGYYRPGDLLLGDVSADYTFGKPVVGAAVRIDAKEFVEDFHTFATVEGRTDGEGKFHFEILLKEFFVGQELKQGNAILQLESTVTDGSHAQQRTLDLTVTERPILIQAFPESGDLVGGVQNIVYLVTAYPDGRPAKTQVLIHPNWDGSGSFQGTPEILSSSETGVCSYATDQGLFTVIAQDAQGLQGSEVIRLNLDTQPEGLLLRPDKPVYSVGDTARVALHSTARAARVFVDVVRDRHTLLMKSVDVGEGRGEILLDLSQDLAGTLALNAYRILTDGDILRDTRVIQVNRPDDLTVNVSMDKTGYQPGDKAVLQFLVSQPDGTPVESALGLAAVDEAVFALSDMQPGLEAVYFGLQEEILKPKYESHAMIPASLSDVVAPEQDAALEEAVSVLMSAAQTDATPSVSCDQSYDQRMQSILEARRANGLRISRIGMWIPVGLYGLLLIPLVLYGLLKLLRRDPIRGSESDLSRLRSAMGSVTWRWAMGFYFPPIVAFGSGFLSSEVSWMASDMGGDRVMAIGALAGSLFMFLMLLLAVWRMRRCPAATAFPAFRRAVWFLPGAYLMVPASVFSFIKGSQTLLVDERVILFGLGGMCMAAALVFGVLALGRNCALRKVSFLGWFWILITRTCLVGAPVWILVILAAMTPSFRQTKGRGVENALGYLGGDNVRVEERLKMAEIFQPTASPEAETALTESSGESPILQKPTRIRRYFPETLFWMPELITDASGKAQVEIPLADSITTWRVAAHAVSMEGALGDASAGLKVFQDFFVDIDFPVSLTQNDQVSVPIIVYNYLDQPQTVRLEASSGEWCQWIYGAIRTLKIGPQQVMVETIPLKALTPGRHSLTIKAYGSRMADAVERQVQVMPDGEAVVQTFNGALAQNLTQELTIPEEAIEKATDLFVKIYPGSFSQVVEGMDSIFQMPSGCFEQTSSTTYPNVLVLDYLRQTRQAKPDLEMKATECINLGYQRLLSYEVSGGGFEWFGNAPAHTVLTAYGLTEFADMAAVWDVDPQVIARTTQWLFSQQTGEGTWEPSTGGIAEGAINAFQGAAFRTTAYVAWALADSGQKDPRLDRALDHLQSAWQRPENVGDAYTLGLCANALGSAGRDATAILSELDRLKVQEKETVHWSSSSQGVTSGTGMSLDVETTGLVVQAMLRVPPYVDLAHKGLTWLIEKKDAQGTWYSTQATVQALRALLAGTEADGHVTEDVPVTIAANGQVVQELTITPETADVFRWVDLKPFAVKGKNTVALESSGRGQLAYQIVATHYRPWVKKTVAEDREALEIEVQYDRTWVARDQTITCRVHVANFVPGAAQMTIVDLGVPPGFEVKTEDLQSLKDQGIVQRISVTGRQILLYFQEIRAGTPVDFSFRLLAKFPVKAKAPRSRAYQYYNPEVEAVAPPVELSVN